MNKVVQEAVIDGYGSGETDFGGAVAALDAVARTAYDFVIVAATSAIARADTTCVLTIAGHSDRVDTPGVGREVARAQELQSSQDRAESAAAYITAEIRAAVPGLPDDLNTLDNFALVYRASGAALLIESGAVLTDPQRRANRRVQVRAIAFVP